MLNLNFIADCIKEFLYLAPHNQKFIFSETAQVLHKSASSKKDFSGYKAATGWHAIQMYAGNLLAQPWRKEYRQLNVCNANISIFKIIPSVSFIVKHILVLQCGSLKAANRPLYFENH